MRITLGNACLLAVLLGLIGLDLAHRPPPLEVIDVAPLLPGLAPRDVDRIVIERPGADEAGRVELARGDGGWAVGQRHGFPAEVYAVEDLLAGLCDLSTEQRASTSAGAHAALGVGDDGTSVVLSDATGAVRARLVLGLPRDASAGSAAVHVRRAEGVEVLRAPRLAMPSTDPAAWLRTQVLEVEAEAVSALRATWTAADGTARSLELARSAGLWHRSDAPGGATVPVAPVRDLLGAVSFLHLVDVAGDDAATGLGAESLRLELTVAGEEPIVLTLGAPSGDGVAATSSRWARPWVGRLPVDTAQLLEDALERLLLLAG